MNLALSAASIILGCIALEIGLRAINHLWTLQNFSGVFLLRPPEGTSINATDKTGDVLFDPLLGWIHQPGSHALWNMTGEGNQFVAEQLRAFMQQQGIIPENFVRFQLDRCAVLFHSSQRHRAKKLATKAQRHEEG